MRCVVAEFLSDPLVVISVGGVLLALAYFCITSAFKGGSDER